MCDFFFPGKQTGFESFSDIIEISCCFQSSSVNLCSGFAVLKESFCTPASKKRKSYSAAYHDLTAQSRMLATYSGYQFMSNSVILQQE